jgi:hypothetical protein
MLGIKLRASVITKNMMATNKLQLFLKCHKNNIS